MRSALRCRQGRQQEFFHTLPKFLAPVKFIMSSRLAIKPGFPMGEILFWATPSIPDGRNFYILSSITGFQSMLMFLVLQWLETAVVVCGVSST